MGRLFRTEIYRITHSPVSLVLTIALFALGYLTRQRSGLFVGIDAEYVFCYVFYNPFPLLWTGTLLAAFSFQECFGSRTFQGAVLAGGSRSATAMSHILPYYLWGSLLDLASMLLIFLMNGVFLRMGTITIPFLLSRLLLHTLFCMVLMTLPVVFAFLFRDVLYGMLFSGGAAFFTQVLLGRITAEESPLLYRLHPAFQMTDTALWMAKMDPSYTDPSYLFAAVGQLLLLLTGGVMLSLLLFRQTELK